MQTLNTNEINQVNGGILFLVIPGYVAYTVIAAELAIIAAIASTP